jgi:phosphohistidine phosphatase
MFLYLVQHAEAKKEEEDPARPLSGKGLKDIRKVAFYLSRLDISIEQILRSNKLRARQTAEVLSENLKPSRGLLETDGLAPLDDPKIWEERLKSVAENLMLVGHLPHLGRLTSLLICGQPERSVVSFRMAGVVCLERDEQDGWSLRWMVTPDILPDAKTDGREDSDIYSADLGL